MTSVRCDPETTSEAYAHGADAYDDEWSPVILPPALHVVERLDISRASRVLDVGAGTGALTPALRAAAPDARIVSIDPVHEMLRYAHERRHVLPVLADALALPVPPERVDAALLAYVLFMLADPAAGLREVTRVLRPGGRVGTVTWASEEPARAATVWDETVEGFGVPALPAHSNHAGLETEAEIARLLGDVGLIPCHVWRETVEHTFERAALWRLRTSHGMPRLRLANLDADRRARVLDELRDRLAPLPPSAFRFRGTLVCSVGQKPQT